MLRRNRKGFTLVELMIVVAIIALLVAIAIPNLLRARLNANSSAAIGMLRTLQTAMESFRAAQNAPTYPVLAAGAIGAVGTALTLQGELPPYVSGFTVATAAAAPYEWDRSGYTFGCAGALNTYQCRATPTVQGTTGVDAYCVDEQGVIMVTVNAALGAPVTPGACPGVPKQ
ncbi:MAG: type II secretion system protein [Candidatus Omnitrophica bacterium]|nr:type II secretion system protein [Candidatus Omnitrophota bacterium]